MNILIAEDDATSARVLQRALTKGGYDVTVARDGIDALAAMKQKSFDALLTDWMMPRMDGIELIRQVRRTADPVPVIIVVTALVSDTARIHALEVGADDYLAKPYQLRKVLELLENCLARKHQPALAPPAVSVGPNPEPPPFVGVVIGASTGGPQAIKEVIHSLGHQAKAGFFVVLHAPPWALEAFAQSLQRTAKMKVNLAEEGMHAVPGEIYLASGNRHLVIATAPLRLCLLDEPPENYVRPAADPLFRSAARAFGRHCIATVMTGLGRDAASGASHVADAGGLVIVQDPATAAAPSMPRTVIDMGITKNVAPLADIAHAISRNIRTLSSDLTSSL